MFKWLEKIFTNQNETLNIVKEAKDVDQNSGNANSIEPPSSVGPQNKRKVKPTTWTAITILLGLAFFTWGFIYLLAQFKGLPLPVTKEIFFNNLFYPSTMVIVGLGTIAIGIYIRVKRNTENNLDLFFIVISLSLFGGFIIYLIIIYLQPEQFFAKPPENPWWTALALVNTLLLATLAIIYNYRKEIIEKQTQIDTLKKSTTELTNEKNMMKVDIENLKTKHLEIEELRDLSKLIVETDNLEGDSYSAQFNKIKDVIKSNNNNQYIKSELIRSLSVVAWKLNDLSDVEDLRKVAYEKDPADLWNKLYYANALIEISSVPEDSLKKILIGDYPPQSEEYCMHESIWGKFYAKNNNFAKALTYYQNIIATNLTDSSSLYTVGYMTCLLCLGELEKMKKFISETQSKLKITEVEWLPIFYDLSNVFIDYPTNYKSFLTNFYVLNNQKFGKITAYERHSFFHVYDALNSIIPVTDIYKKEKLNCYLIYYKFYGDNDDSADEQLDRDNKANIIDELEEMLMKNMYPKIQFK